MRAPTTTDTHPTTTTRTADARSVVRAIGRQACGGRCLRVVLTDAIGSRSRTNRRAAAVGPSLVSVLRLPYVPPRLQWEVTHRYSPLTTWVRNSGQASEGISLHFPSARRSAARDGPEGAGTPSDGRSCRPAVCARHER